MSLQHDSASDSTSDDMRLHEIDQSAGSSLTLQTDPYQSEVQSFDSLPPEIMEGIDERSDHAQSKNELTICDQLTMLQDTFKTVGGDLEEIKTLMFKLRDVLKTDGDDEVEINKQRYGCSGESSNDISVIEEDDDNSSLPRDRRKCPTRESSSDSLDADSKYSTLISDIEVLRNKLVSLKRNLAE